MCNVSRTAWRASRPVVLLIALLIALPLWAGLTATAHAQALKGEVSTTVENGYARLLFKFEDEIDAQVRLANNILTINFPKPVDVSIERIAHLKQLEAQINDIVRAKDEAEATRVKNLVTMYENMKPKDAARVFDRLDMKVVLDVATQINPRRMSDIMAQMAPEAAERLTVELATRAKDKPPAELPKINGQPTN